MGKKRKDTRSQRRIRQNSSKKETVKINTKKETLVALKCMHCNAPLDFVDASKASCPYCGHEYLLDKAEGTEVNIEVDYEDNPELQRSIRKIPKILIGFLLMAALIVFLLFQTNMEAFENVSFFLDRTPEDDTNRPLMELFCEDVFGKDYDDITEEEFASIKCIEYDGWWQWDRGTINTIEYSFEDYKDYDNDVAFEETFQKWTYNTEYIVEYIDSLDFSMLTGLNRVNLVNCKKIDHMKFSEECDVTYVESSHSLNEVAKVFDPARIQVLHLDCEGEGITSLEGIKNYRALEEFSFEERYTHSDSLHVDISEVTECKNLRSLILKCGETYGKTDCLKEMTQLETLCIDNMTLAECDFLKEMTRLKALYIKCGEEADLSVLTNHTELETLWFLDSEKVDATPIVGLDKLKNLRITVTNGEVLPVISQLKALEKLHIGFGFATYGTPMDVTSLKALSKLSELKFELAWNYGVMGVEELFSLPALQSLTFSAYSGPPVDLYVDPNALAQNDTLISLAIQNSMFKDVTNGETLTYDILTCCTEMKNLHVTTGEVKNIEFVKAFPKLENFTLLGNEIDSYEPLSSCKRLKKLCLASDYLTGKHKDEIEALSDGIEIEYEDGYIF